MNEYKIKKFHISDYKSLISLYQKSGLAFKAQGRDSYVELKNQIKDDKCIIYLAIAGKEIIGSVLVTHDTRKGWINRLAVVPEYRRKGVASSLVIKAEQWLENKGIEIVACLIEGWNKDSMKFFQKRNYKQYPDVAYYTKRKYPEV